MQIQKTKILPEIFLGSVGMPCARNDKNTVADESIIPTKKNPSLKDSLYFKM